MRTLGQTITMWRKERKLTQEALARLAGLSRPNLSMIEQDGRDVTVGTLRRLAQALSVSCGQLVDGLAPSGAAHSETFKREELDRIAKRLAGKGRTLSVREEAVVSTVRPLIRHQLEAPGSGQPLPRTARLERQSLIQARILLGPAQVENLLTRLRKELQRKS